ncbi:MAG: sodium:solute symporter family protein [Acidobacteriaceae bacterium]|nr:sodium:solute symporter family protein [Acidobacteriaceae bacterium]
MSSSTVALSVIFGIVGSGTVAGFFSRAHHKMDLEQWTVAGRGFGAVLVYLLMAGEVYTTFSFLGASGWAYSRGGPTLYILAYLTLGYVISFFILPPIWEMGKRYRLQTQSDFFRVRYGNEYLAAFVCMIGVLSFIPYVQLQLTGLGIIVQIASFDSIGRAAAMTISTVLVAAFVYVGGIRAVAWVSVLKDALMLLAAVSIGVALPQMYFGGAGKMFTALLQAHPRHLTMPGATQNLGHNWFISTVLLTSCGLYMWPHSFGSTFTARSGETLRRNAIVMPLYTTTIAFIFMAGFTALLVLPPLSNGDLALLTLVRKSFPPWLLGIVGGAGALTAMVPSAIFLLTASTLFVKNLFRPLFAPRLKDEQVSQLARLMVVALSLCSLYLAIYSSATLVSMLLLGYAGVSQLFPGVVLGLYWERTNPMGVFAGIFAGVGIAAVLFFTHREPWFGWSAGFLGLCVNSLIVVFVSALRPAAEKVGAGVSTNLQVIR